MSPPSVPEGAASGPSRRIAAIALFRVRVGIARAKEPDDDRPLAVVVSRPGSSVKDETSLLGNTRLDEVSREAWELGVRPGSTIAAARARAADLRVRVVSSSAVSATLARLAEAALAFGATVAFSEEEDMVWVDVTGCGHLFATKEDPSGEATLAARLGDRVRGLGHIARVAVASGPRLAAAFARHAPHVPGHAFAPVLVPSHRSEAAMARLSIAALPLDEGTRAWLGKLGVRTVGDVRALPEDALGTRLGGEGVKILPLARGEDLAPLVPYVPPTSPEERIELEYGVEATAALLFVARTLADRMAARLEGRALATTRLSLFFELDRALLPRDAPHEARALHLNLAAPMQRGAEIFAVLRARLESGTEAPLAAPVRAVVLRAADLVAPHAAPLDLFVPEARAERALPRLYEELAAELGIERVGLLTLESSYRPEARAKLVPLPTRRATSEKKARAVVVSPVRATLVSRGVEPTRLLPVSVPFLAPHEGVESCHFLGRLEAVEWWRAPLASPARAPKRREEGAVDLLAVWLEEEQGMAWVEVDRATGVALVRGWLE